MRTLPGLAASLVASVAAAQCIQAPGTPVTVTQDSISPAIAIGFAFPFEGSTYTDIHISDHGICFLSNGGTPMPPAATPLVYSPEASSLVANGPVICPFWSDTVPTNSTSTNTAGFFVDSQATTCTVTWRGVESFGFPAPGTSPMSFQLRLFDNGNLEFVYGPNVTNNSTFGGASAQGVIGLSPGQPATLPAEVDLSMGPSTTEGTVFEEFAAAFEMDMALGSLLFQPASPGWDVTFIADGAGCARSEVFGVGCDGLTLTTTDEPNLGTTWELTTSGVSSSAIAITYFALGRSDPPVPLTSLNYPAPGCDVNLLLTAVFTNLLGTVNAGQTSVSIAVPNLQAFVNVTITAQSIAFSNANAAGFATSNGAAGIFGR
ncbi:MAG: hypothetical protein NXI31_10915 [bacterium]|nr:hypothetical protein [bacterium]